MIGFFNKIRSYLDQKESQHQFDNSSLQSAVIQRVIQQIQTNQKNDKLYQLLKSQTVIDYYKKVRVHQFNQAQRVKQVFYVVQQNLSSTWKKYIYEAHKDINEAVPGLKLIQLKKPIQRNFKPLIQIKKNNVDECWTQGNIFVQQKTTIKLSQKWQIQSRKGTSIHQLLHALGVQHQHSRKDSRNSIKFNYNQQQLNNNQKYNFLSQPDIMGLTRFDPFTVMIYQQDQKMQRVEKDKIWKLKSQKKRRKCLSELDKVGLNLLFKPCKNEQQKYFPKKSYKTSLFYCGRKVMEYHNYPANSMTDGRCGPNNGPNCPACRVLVNQQLNFKLGDSRFQGMSGAIYCGKKFKESTSDGHDGFCGPNNGDSCNQCQQLLN